MARGGASTTATENLDDYDSDENHEMHRLLRPVRCDPEFNLNAFVQSYVCILRSTVEI